MKAANKPKYGQELGMVRTCPYSRGGKGRRVFNAKCFSCGSFIHMARFCSLAQSSLGSSVKRECDLVYCISSRSELNSH